MSSDPVLDALNAAAGRAAPAPGQAGSAPAGAVADPVLAALQTRAVQPDAAAAPVTPPRGFLQQTGDFLSAGVHHAANLPWAAGQLLSNAVAAPFRLAPDNPVSKAVIHFADDSNDIVSNRETAYQAATPNSPGAYAGATLGSVAPLLVGGVGGGLQSAGDAAAARVAPYLPRVIAPLGAKVVSGATQGAVVGALQPVTSKPLGLADLVAPREPEPSFWDAKADQVGYGAAFGGAVPVAVAPVAAAWNAGKRAVVNSPILNPSRYAANQVGIQLGDNASTVASNLQSAPTYVPGSVPTAAQAGADPTLVMIEKSLANKSPAFQKQLQDRQIGNNAARWDVINGVGQTPDALQAAIDARDAATKPMRDFTVTNGNPVPVSGVNGAVSGVAYGTPGVSDTIGPAARAMQSKIDSFTTTTPPDTLMNVPGSTTASPAMLDELRQTVNTYLAKNAPNGVVGTKEQAAMMPVKSAIIDAIDAANPGHKLNSVMGPLLPDAGLPVIRNPVNVVKKWGSRMANEPQTLAGLPPVSNGQVRLFRAESPTQGFDDAFDGEGLAAARAVQTPGQRYTSSFKMADYYRDAYNANNDATIHYIDLPKDVASSLQVAPEEFKVSAGLRVPPYSQRGASTPDGGLAGPEAPSYRDYLTQFATRSVPVNTMQVGQTLAEQLGSKAVDASGTPLLTLGNYSGKLATALRNSPYAIDPEAQAALEGVQSDLQRATASSSVRAPGGSDTAYNTGAGATFLKALGAGSDSDAKAAAAAAATFAATGSAKTAAAAGFGASKASGWVTNRVSDALGDLMMDPKALAQALMQGSPSLSAHGPSAFGRIAGRSMPAIRAALAAELLKAQAPQVVGPDQKKAEAYQP